jgi:serine/threonine protein kinase
VAGNAANALPHIKKGFKIKNYIFIKPISKGAFASVYEGFDLKQNINVAIKAFSKREISK